MYSRSDATSSVQQYTYTNAITVPGSLRARSDTVCKIFYDRQRVRLSGLLVCSRQVHTVKDEARRALNERQQPHEGSSLSVALHQAPSRLHGGWCTTALCGPSRSFDHKRRAPRPSSPRLPGPRMHTPPVDR